MPAVSKKQQRFFGMVRAAQKGEMKNPSSEVLDVADDISVKDAKKFAKTKHKGLPEKKKMKENVTLQDANGNDFIEIIDLIKPEPLVKKEEDNYSTRDRELKKTKKGRDQRYKVLHKATNDKNNVDVNEDVSYKETLTVTQFGKAGNKILSYNFINAFPTAISPITLDWNASEIEEFSCTWTYDYWTRNKSENSSEHDESEEGEMDED